MAEIRNVHQLLTGATPGNAIYNEILVLQAALREWGYRSEVFAERIHPTLSKQVSHFATYAPTEHDLLIFHYSIGSALSDYVKTLSTPMVLLYHNITPARYLSGTHPWLLAGTIKGRKELPDFATKVLCAWADSEYNRQELLAAGFKNTRVLPLLQPDDLFQVQPDDKVLARFPKGLDDTGSVVHTLREACDGEWLNLLFVGRVAPNKRPEDLIKILYYAQRIHARTRLLLVGADQNAGQYGRWLRTFVHQLGLQDTVHFCGHVSLAALAAYYQVADVFVCMSEHEGFCGPIVESMRSQLPVVAYASSAVPETMGAAGILVTQKEYAVIAEVIHLLHTDTHFRQQIIAGQLQRVKAFNQDKSLEQFQRYLAEAIALCV